MRMYIPGERSVVALEVFLDTMRVAVSESISYVGFVSAGAASETSVVPSSRQNELSSVNLAPHCGHRFIVPRSSV